MQRTEFDEWLAMHCARFSGVARMIENDVTIANDWFQRLSGVTVDEAVMATREIMALEPQPFPGDHLGKMHAITKAMRFKPRESNASRFVREETFKCLDCHDRGVIWVFHPMAYGPIKDDCFNAGQHLREIVVACGCPAGQQHCNKGPDNIAKKDSHPDMLKFNTDQMLPCDGKTEVDLIEFVTTQYRPKNHFREFDAFA